MVVVSIAAVLFWRRVSRLPFKWFWLGAGLWAVAVALKVPSSLLLGESVIGFLREHLSYPLFVAAGGLFYGIQSSFFEIGLTLLAVLIWVHLGRDAERAIGIGVGAGVFEALLLGIVAFVVTLLCLAEIPALQEMCEITVPAVEMTPLLWLVAPTERVIAILCHAASRALVLLGVAKRRYMLVVWGFLLFTGLDGVAGGAHVGGWVGEVSYWRITLVLAPFALISIVVLRWSHSTWRGTKGQGIEPGGGAAPTVR